MAMLEGTLSKWTNVMKGWQYRWFVLDEYAGLLSYYTSKEKMMKGVRRGCVRLKGAIIGIDDQDVNTFTITVDHKTFHFQARDADEREKWVRRLEDTILRHANRSRALWDQQYNNGSGTVSAQSGGPMVGSSTSAVSTGGGSTGGIGTPSVRRSNNLILFDRKVTEADAFLQLMIDQTTKIATRLEELGEEESEEATRLKTINDHANAMLDNIKHSIVLLQITKRYLVLSDAENNPAPTPQNTANPINGIYQGPVLSKSETETEPSDSGLVQSVLSASLPTGIEVADECRESVRRGTIVHASISVPETSYSSSEGEDDFFDANDDPFSSSQLNTPTSNTRTLSEHTGRLSVEDNYATAEDTTSNAGSVKKQDSIEPSSISGGATGVGPSAAGGHEYAVTGTVSSHQRPSRKSYDSKSLPIRTDGSLDYDALYEDESDNDLSMESHGSVVTHLLSQVKIGMDLTKVVLPTFILERRSLLEMYADYFAHPDLFLRIADLKDARERMVQVVRWYLSAYHAGRKSSVAKKPYNPILGEIFQCHWDTPEMPTGDEASNVEVKDGPVPWCRRDQLTFIAEQVSHHPPISAFYAEHYNKKISFSAHVWTKSKFLGLSIGVHNIGQGTVTLCDLNEEYIVTFPNGYGRSILTIPWIELGGTVTINCPQTGYRADIDFLTKPFYGGKKNRIQGEIYGPNDKKSFLSISGEWSGLMEYKFNDGSKPSKFETFVDVNSIPIYKKKVRPVSEQQENESRRVWREVTAGLKMNDIEKATNAKFQVEQKQREEAKERKDTFGEWETKYFKGVNGESWVYATPLLHRLTLENRDSKR
ncbi:oxysterol-binding protein-related protein 9 isoform X1 [Anopheles darlingi]|uniref:oxysterol-binding protein-related protein 9 isoform X1 n=2 Tax=Anopheles darlingi TaxID=43151 RepID=UPI00210039E7|nr:oxysterol-binding protein-related protein 9 isoform X1 [Anopheles darlingi]XP_049544382.1 oxysterol-binding protein-related protein 9 isoform X1 [Anopheles darlingi]